MKRRRATDLAVQLLEALCAGREEWPLCLVTEVAVFGSYARGATDPHDLDIAVDIDRHDDRWINHFVRCLSYGPDPYLVIRRALVGGSRSCQFMFDNDGVDFPLTLLWRRGDSLDVALDRLYGIAVDVNAGRAPRDAMLPQFEGLDRWIPRPYRECLADAVNTGAITLDRLELPDVPVSDPAAQDHLYRRWAPTSPLYRAGHAALAHFEQTGIAPAQVHLHGQDVAGPDTPYFAGFALRYFRSIPVCLSDQHGLEWIDVIHPTRTLPMIALQIRPTQPGLLTAATWP